MGWSLIAIYIVLQGVAVVRTTGGQRILALAPLVVTVPSSVYVFGLSNPDDNIFSGLLFVGTTIFSIAWLCGIVLGMPNRSRT